MSEATQLALGLAWLVLSIGAFVLVAVGLPSGIGRRKPRYVYGRVYRPADCRSRAPVRLDTQTGRVQFVLWKAGQQGHTEDYWHDMGYGWEEFFVPDVTQERKQ